jgi:hypothetical protein
MNDMASFFDLAINAMNLTNGLQASYQIQIESTIEIRAGDIFYFTLPSEMSAE